MSNYRLEACVGCGVVRMKIGPLVWRGSAPPLPKWFGGTPVYLGGPCARCELKCDICGERTPVTGVKGYSVCSQECADKAADMEPHGGQPR